MVNWKQLAAVTVFTLVLLGIAAVTPGGSISAEQAADLLIQDSAGVFTGKNIYFAETNGEPSRFDRGGTGVSTLAAILRSLGANIYSLDWRLPLPSTVDVIVIPNPGVDYPADQISRLWAFMQRGGRVFMAINPTTDRVGRERGAFTSANGFFVLSNLDFGLSVGDNVIVQEAVINETPVLVPRFSTSDYDTSHPILAGVEGELAFNNARSVVVNLPGLGGSTTGLIFAPEGFYGESAYQAYIDTGAHNFDIGADTTPGRIPLAAAYDNPATGARLVLFGDRDIVTNGFGFTVAPAASLGFVYPNNVRVVLQAFAWLLDSESPVLSFPTAGITATPTITPSPLPPTATPTPSPMPPTATPTPGS